MIRPIPQAVLDAYHRAMQSVQFDQCTAYDRCAIERYITELEIRLEITAGRTDSLTAADIAGLQERYRNLGIEAFGITEAEYAGAPHACDCLVASIRADELQHIERQAEFQKAEQLAELPATERLNHHRYPKSRSLFRREDHD